jgi:hypothetical protein
MSAPAAEPKAAKASTPVERKKRQPIDPNETARDRFLRLAQGRTGSALNTIKGIGVLGNKAQYDYGDEDVDKIETALIGAVTSSMKALRAGKPVKSGFSL